MILAVLIGGGTGVGVVTFHYLIELVHDLMLRFNGNLSLGAWTLACVDPGRIGWVDARQSKTLAPLSSLIAAAQAGSPDIGHPTTTTSHKDAGGLGFIG